MPAVGIAAVEDPVSRVYSDWKRAESKRHNQALLALARRRWVVLIAILQVMTLCDTTQLKAAGPLDEEHRDPLRFASVGIPYPAYQWDVWKGGWLFAVLLVSATSGGEEYRRLWPV
jgi:hypothetical protein